MAYINEFPHTRNYDQDLGQLICMYKKLKNDYGKLVESYDTLVQIYEIVKKDIKDITIEELQKWLDDGTLETIISKYVDEYVEETNNKIEQIEVDININGKFVQLANNITYDLPAEYSDWYSQGIASAGDILYIYIEKNDNGKLLAFNHKEYTYIGEYDINLHHGGDLTILNGVMYVATYYDKNLICIDLNNFNVTSLPLDITENKINGIAKFDNDNLVILAANDAASNFINSTYYLYNINSNTLTSLTLESDVLINFYAVQGMTSKNGYLYQAVSNPDQILKAKIDTNANIINFIAIYNLPEKDNLGLLIGEYEGIDFIDDNNMIISSHILDDVTTSRTIKTYCINVINGIPSSLKHYPDTFINEQINNIDQMIFLDKGKNINLYYENGTQNYPFKSLARAVNYSHSNNIYSIRVYNNGTTASSNVIYSMFTIPNNSKLAFDILANNIEIDFGRILGSDVLFNSQEIPTTNSFVKILNYEASEQYGNINNSNVTFICNLNVIKQVDIRNSTIKDISKVTSTIASGTGIFRVRRNSVYYANTEWTNTNSNNTYFHVHDGATLFINNVLSDQSTWYSTHVINGGSTAYNVIFCGIHYNS